MKKIIPRHCLVILFNEVISSDICRKFKDYEFTSYENVNYELIGEQYKKDIRYIVMDEVSSRLHVKLDLGERVVVNVPDIRKDERISLAKIASRKGVPVFYIGTTHTFKDKELRAGDNLAELVNIDHCEITIIAKQTPQSMLELRNEGWQGVTFVGDVHGMYQSFLDVIAWCRSRRQYMICAGDLLDYGRGTLDVMDEMHNIFVRGEGEMLIGNHERKIHRWIMNEAGRHSMHLSEGNKVTIDKLMSLDAASRQRWIGRFQGIIAQSKMIRKIDNLIMAHAAIHPSYWQSPCWTRDIENWALFGEYTGPASTYASHVKHYKWIDNVPTDTIVCVGHDPRRMDAPLVVSNKNKGTVVFTDTGSAKGGILSSVDIGMGEKMTISNFNLY